MTARKSKQPPVIILGGGANALSIARSLGRAGVRVYALNRRGSHVRYSRYCEWIPVPEEGRAEDAWAAYLISARSERLRGSVLLAASDAGLETIAKNRELLARKFILDLSDPDAQLCMLNKQCTYQKARAAGVPTPKFWLAETRQVVLDLREHLVYPLIVKPLYSHRFQLQFGKKFIVADDFDELLDAFNTVQDARVETMLVEMIPGSDENLCSYYTYIDEQGRALFDFTKRVIRRYPVNMGGATYHITDWNPEVKPLALKLFRHAGLRGLANAEFKLDERDGQLKLMECNARFTAANCLVTAAGFDLALFVYNRLTGRPQPSLNKYRVGLRMWDPGRDVLSFLQLRRQGEITFWGWVRSLLHPQVYQWFSWQDPVPSLMSLVNLAQRGIRR